MMFSMSAVAGATETSTQVDIRAITTVPKGTGPNTGTYPFDITPISLNGDEGRVAEVPEVTIVEGPAIENGVSVENMNRTVTITSTLEDILADVVWPQAGVFLYRVTAGSPTYIHVNENSTPDVVGLDTVPVNGGTQYDLEILVKREGSDFVVDAVVIHEVNRNGVRTGNKSEHLDFNYTYWEIMEFTISNEVTGDYGDKEKTFSYVLTVEKNGFNMDRLQTSDEPRDYIQVFNADDEPIRRIDDPMMGGISGPGYYISFMDFDFELAHGEYAVFYGVVGDYVSLRQQSYGEEGYATTIHFEDSETSSLNHNGTVTSLGGKHVAFVNHFDMTIPTGVSLASLPWVGLALALALGAVYLLTRKRDDADAWAV